MESQIRFMVKTFIVFLSLMLSSESIVRAESVTVSNDHYQLTVSEINGEILSFVSHGRETIQAGKQVI